MAYFAFRLDELNCIYQRGKIMDVDIVTFAVTVNNEPHGGIVGRFGMASGQRVPASAVAPDIRGKFGLELGGWIVGPVAVNPGDLVEVKYSAMNVSDIPPGSDDKIAASELPMLGALYGAAAGALGGPLIATAAGLAGGFTNIIEKALGYQPTPACNGLVFADIKQFSGSGLASLPYTDTPNLECGLTSFTNSYDDSATHESQCGHIAQTEVTFSVMSYSTLSFQYFASLFWPGRNLSGGVRQLVAAGQATSLRAMLTT